ncbi:MAG: DMT family transporter [Aggregatilineales bacterium]
MPLPPATESVADHGLADPIVSSASHKRSRWSESLTPVLLSPLFLGMAPILGKMAYAGGSDPFTLAALRTTLAALILWVVYAFAARPYLFIYPAGLLGCVVVGTVNGIGSLMYYNGLRLVDASVAQVLNATYLLFVVIMARMAGQRLTARTLVRVGLALCAVVLLAAGNGRPNDWLGIGLMLGNAILFAGTVILSQRVLYEMPAPTMTLYTLSAMAVVVVMARVIYRLAWLPQSDDALLAIGLLAVTTALSRLTLFSGVKQMGGLQTTLVVALETGIAVLLSLIFLHETLSTIQWIGIVIMSGSLLLARPDDLKQRNAQVPSVVNMAGVQFNANSTAFVTAFKIDPDEKSNASNKDEQNA